MELVVAHGRRASLTRTPPAPDDERDTGGQGEENQPSRDGMELCENEPQETCRW